MFAISVVACREPSQITAADPAAGPVTPALPSAPNFFTECTDPTLGCPEDSDAHVSADITYRTTYTATLSESFVDPVSGQTTNTLNVNTPDVRLHADAGYTPQGAVKITASYTDGADPTTAIMPQVIRQDLTGNTLTDLNSSDYALQTSTPTYMDAAPAMTLVGSTTNGDVTAGMLVDIDNTLTSSSRATTESLTVSRSITASSLKTSVAFARAEFGGVVSTALHGVPVLLRLVRPGIVVAEDASSGSPLALSNSPAGTANQGTIRESHAHLQEG